MKMTKNEALRLLKGLNMSLDEEIEEEYFFTVLKNYITIE